MLYEAVEFIKEITEGATSRPWLIRAIPEGGIIAEEFIVKLYKDADDLISYPVLKECYANKLCKEFDLYAPQVGLIVFTNEFRETLPIHVKSRISMLGHRPLFATKFIPNLKTFSHSYIPNSPYYDIETIFAFDALIMNRDRKESKANLALGENKFVLFDHEHTLDSLNGNTVEWPNTKWDFLRKEDNPHIFYRTLKRRKPDFETFLEYLRNLDLAFGNEMLAELQGFDYNTLPAYEINDWLEYCKKHPQRFLSRLMYILK